MDPCQTLPLQCLNNGRCAVNNSMNSTYCQCDACHEGRLCEVDVWKQNQFDTAYVYMIVYIIGLCLSVLNNGLCLELFIGCRRIRRTNCGIYLFVYSILSLVSSILLVVDGVVAYYPNQLKYDKAQFQILHCYGAKIGYNMLVYLCIWFSSCIAFERGLIVWFDGKMGATRWRSIVTVIVMLLIASGSATPLLIVNCDWDRSSILLAVRGFFVWFYTSTGLAIYVLASLLILISFARRVRSYGMEDGSFVKTFLKLFGKHLFIFIPPIAYVISNIPYNIVINTKSSNHSYFQCGISVSEYVVKVLLEVWMGTPPVVTWLLFVFPSKVYMTEFYVNTWSGRWIPKIITFWRQWRGKIEDSRLP